MTSATSQSVQQQVGSDPAGRNVNRADNDFYRTSPQAVLPLFKVEKFPGTVWECACGNGAISHLLELQPEVTKVLSTDLVDRGHGTSGVDFLTCEWPEGVDHVVTNPPYTLAEAFALRVLSEDRLRPGGKLALFCRTLWKEGQRRKDRLFRLYPLARIWTHSRRVPMARGVEGRMATGLISFSWFVWEYGWKGPHYEGDWL